LLLIALASAAPGCGDDNAVPTEAADRGPDRSVSDSTDQADPGDDTDSGGSDSSETGSDSTGRPPIIEGTLLADPTAAFPPTLTEVGLFPDPTDLGLVPLGVIAYQPVWQLWSNGSLKIRHLLLPPGAPIDTADPTSWVFPEGTMLFKTFTFPDGEDGWYPIETRIIRRQSWGWEFVAYQWNDDRSDAELLDMLLPVRVEFEDEAGETAQHAIPSRLMCRECHESAPTIILGFNELQLNDQVVDGDQLGALESLGIFEAGLSETPPMIEGGDELTTAVMGYITANCTHCHNGGDGPSSTFDMRHDVFLEQTINHETVGQAAAGIRIVPGSPDESILFLAFSRETENPEIPAMPPVGVQTLDADGIEMLRNWLTNLED
jgi:hypothetical protein